MSESRTLAMPCVGGGASIVADAIMGGGTDDVSGDTVGAAAKVPCASAGDVSGDAIGAGGVVVGGGGVAPRSSWVKVAPPLAARRRRRCGAPGRRGRGGGEDDERDPPEEREEASADGSEERRDEHAELAAVMKPSRSTRPFASWRTLAAHRCGPTSDVPLVCRAPTAPTATAPC